MRPPKELCTERMLTTLLAFLAIIVRRVDGCSEQAISSLYHACAGMRQFQTPLHGTRQDCQPANEQIVRCALTGAWLSQQVKLHVMKKRDAHVRCRIALLSCAYPCCSDSLPKILDVPVEYSMTPTNVKIS